ncbi:restriction endonuclease subunit S [Streptomyces sp. NPDC002926]
MKPAIKLKYCLAASDSGTWGDDYAEITSATPVLRSTEIGLDGSVDPREPALRSLSTHEKFRTRLREGDILVVRSSGSDLHLGKAGFVGAPAAGFSFSNFLQRLRLSPTHSPRFAWYFLNCADAKQQIRRLSSTTTGLQNLSAGLISELEIPSPSLDEQCRIADFLDAEVGRIDHLVAKKRHLITLLNERIDSHVLEHVGVSRLVHPTTGARTLPLRRILGKVVRPAVSKADVITAYRDGQVTNRSVRRAEGYTLSASTDPQGQHVRIGDVVVHGLDGFAGAIGTSEAVGNCSPVYHVCVPHGDGDARYLGRLLRLLATQGYLGNFATSTRERAVDFRNWDLFGRIPVPVVSPAEQREIGEWISNVRPLREVIERSAALAAERRQALITAAVTGQFDVTTASGRNVTEGVTV